jgi:hypothetical protein
MDVRFSRHASNKLRLYKLAPADVAEVIVPEKAQSRGDKYESSSGSLRVIWVKVGLYALVVTVIRTK